MDSVSVEVPMTFKLRGGRKVIILPDGTQGNPLPKATIDNTLVKAIARAFRWQAMLETGTYGCIEDIARAERINGSFVSRVIRLALLAPDAGSAQSKGVYVAYTLAFAAGGAVAHRRSPTSRSSTPFSPKASRGSPCRRSPIGSVSPR